MRIILEVEKNLPIELKRDTFGSPTSTITKIDAWEGRWKTGNVNPALNRLCYSHTFRDVTEACAHTKGTGLSTAPFLALKQGSVFQAFRFLQKLLICLV